MNKTRSLKIAVDASRTTRPQRTGTENYALELLRHLLQLNAPHDFHFYFRDFPSPLLFPVEQGSVFTPHVIYFPRLWTHLRFAAELIRSRPDITFVPAHTLPRFFPGKAVVTVHDLGYLYFPEAHPPKDLRYLQWSTAFSARRATRILADSGATRTDLIRHYHIAPEKIHVVYPGVDESLTPVTDQSLLSSVRQKYHLPEKYMLFIGTLQPRKNVERLVKAYALWRGNHPGQEIGLVLAGKTGWLYQSRWVEGVEGVRLTGYVEDTDVAALYSGALALVFPSLYEGFGFPVIEAMRCGVPVLCSNTSSLPELGGDAALLVNPTDTDAIAAGIQHLIENAECRQHMIEKGFRQAQQFNWRAAAQSTLRILEEAAA